MRGLVESTATQSETWSLRWGIDARLGARLLVDQFKRMNVAEPFIDCSLGYILWYRSNDPGNILALKK